MRSRPSCGRSRSKPLSARRTERRPKLRPIWRKRSWPRFPASRWFASSVVAPRRPCRPSASAATIVLPYNDPAALKDTFAERGREIAAVIVEPVAGNMGVVPPEDGFVAALRDVPRPHGALLIADEVITGFRVARGGAQSIYDLHPDLTTLGKIIGGGLPVGAYGGRRDLMEQLAPTGPVYQAGTLSGNPLAMIAGLANLEPLAAAPFYADLAAKTDSLATGLRQAAAQSSANISINAVTGMLTVFFTADPVRDLAGAERADTARYARFFHAMLNRGIYLPPSQFEAWMVSAAHTDEDIERTIVAAAESFTD